MKSTIQQCLSNSQQQHIQNDAVALTRKDFGAPLDGFIDRSSGLDYKSYIESVCKDVLYEIVVYCQ